MRMIFIRGLNGERIGEPFHIEEEEGNALDYMLVGDEVELSFYVGQDLMTYLQTRPADFALNYHRVPKEVDDGIVEYSVNLTFRIAHRKHSLFHSRKHDRVLMEAMHSIILEPAADVDEAGYLFIAKHYPPEWMKYLEPAENGNPSAHSPTETSSAPVPIYEDASLLTRVAELLPDMNKGDLEIARGIILNCMRFSSEARSLDADQFYHAVRQAQHKRRQFDFCTIIGCIRDHLESQGRTEKLEEVGD